MCDPVSLTLAAVQAGSTLMQGRSDKATAYAQAQSLDYQAQQEQEASLKQAAIIRRAGKYSEATATAAFAGAGVKVGAGSAEEVSRQIDIDSEHDAMTAILTGTKRGNALRATGSMERVKGDLAQSSANMKAVGNVMQGGYNAMQASGWRTAGPGFSGQQAPAPVETRNINYIPGRR